MSPVPQTSDILPNPNMLSDSPITQADAREDAMGIEEIPVAEVSNHSPEVQGRWTALFALIVGIDQYQDPLIAKLKGAVADANAIKEYLTKDLGVLPSNITTLLDEHATRARILEELEGLANHPDIIRGNPILIYYAGHGGKMEAPPGWNADGGRVEYILPVDCSSQPGDRPTVPPISDRILGSYLDRIANAKGDNITVVFDSCHSASGTRGASDTSARFVDLTSLFPDGFDSDGLCALSGASSSRATSPKLLNNSHILLAACAKDQSAMEIGQRGVFTVALLHILKTTRMDRTTYNQVVLDVSTEIRSNLKNAGAPSVIARRMHHSAGLH